jgi:hypothetical protein
VSSSIHLDLEIEQLDVQITGVLLGRPLLSVATPRVLLLCPLTRRQLQSGLVYHYPAEHIQNRDS